MDDVKADKKARREADAKVAWDEYHAKQAAIEKNTARLRKLRLAKEDGEAPGAKPAPAVRKPRAK
jgi:hypothetical protein